MGHSVRELVWNRDNWRCRYCGSVVVAPEKPKGDKHPKFYSNTATIDHVVPRSMGGPKSMDNCVTACWSCNHDKGDLTLTEFLFGRRRFSPYKNPHRQQLAAKASKRLHNRIAQHGDSKHALKDLHLALIAERQAS